MTRDSDKLYELIEAWLDGRLSPAESAAFSVKLEGDADLRFRVEQHQFAREVIGQWVAEDYKTKIKSWQQELEESPPPGRESPALKWWIIGVGLLLMIAGGIWYFTPPSIESDTKEPTQQSPAIQNPEQPVAEQYDNSIPVEESQEPMPPAPQKEKPIQKKKGGAIANKERDAADAMLAIANGKFKNSNYEEVLNDRYNRRGSDDGNYKEGKEAFSKKDYKKAIELFSAVPSTSPDYTAALDYLALASYKAGGVEKAVDYYEMFAPRKIGPETDWWLLQFYQADYNRSKAKFWKKLNDMMASPRNTVYKEKAVQLKKELEEMGLKE